MIISKLVFKKTLMPLLPSFLLKIGIKCCYTSHNERHNAVSHSEQVAGYTAIGALVFGLGIGNGHNRIVGTNLHVIYKTNKKISKIN